MSIIAPCLWFDGQAEEAARYYVGIFGGSVDHISYYPQENPSPSPMKGGSVLLVEFTLFGQSYQALNGGPQFTFDEAISLSVGCADQAELDRYFDALTADGGKDGPCGWVTDKYGLCWQLVTRQIMANYHSDDKAGIARMMQAMMTMRKLDTAAMQAAFEGETA
ncbi:3-demethylubiquinone-9 3-methyltransferase [Sphingobium indicum BiD32]|uniref:3-demethylubiquinone-9 3-methyltransferase n=1 Tax=Sphingobium indicum BiD32 TaxID=1301087 RepID=N1MSR1_9SPHN|nr:VOC family protein [Sphingobium indicum]CCW20031.1 3-demethylubiquinone-9 3-methyltransferase [Sphingobium indicum BiD32]